MKFLSLIATIITFGFSINVFSKQGDCNYTVVYHAKYGSEDEVKKAVLNNCKFGYTACETMDDGFITLNPKKMSVTHQLNGLSSEQCDAKALQACRYSKDENIKHRSVAVKFSDKVLSAYMCGPGNVSMAAVPMLKAPLQEVNSAPAPKPEFKKVRVTN